MTRDEQQQRRMLIVERIRQGFCPADVAKEFNVSLATIWTACHAHGTFLQRQRLPLNALIVLAALKRNNTTDVETGRDVGVSREYVRQVRNKAIELGLLEKLTRSER